jgi:hypothetical protein
MILNRSQTLLNSIAQYTADAMAQSIYQSSLANMTLQGVNKGYNAIRNTSLARGTSDPIICGQSICGSGDETCKYQ